MSETKPIALAAAAVPLEARRTILPEPFASRVAGREKRRLGDAFGLQNFGINLTRLEPGAFSSPRHHHAKQDEFVYILEGEPTLITDAGERPLRPGDCAGFRAGCGDAHHLVNRSAADVVYLEVGDCSSGDSVVYPDDDLELALVDGKLRFQHKNGVAY